MAVIEGESGCLEEPGTGNGIGGMSGSVADITQFNASQYAFFGSSVMEEVELGGFEDDEVGIDPGFDGIVEGCQFSHLEDKVDGEVVRSLTDIDNLAITFSKLNKVTVEPKGRGAIAGSGSFSRESSYSATDWPLDAEVSNFQDQHILDAEDFHDGKNWWSHPHSGSVADPKSLYRTSSSPQQQQQFQSSKPIHVSKSSYTSFPPLGAATQFSPNQSHHVTIPSSSSGLQLPFSPPNPYPFSQPRLQAAQLGSSYDGNVSQLGIRSSNSRQQNHWSEQPSLLPWENSDMLTDISRQQRPHLSNQIPPHRPHLQQHGVHQMIPRFPHMQSQQFHPSHSPPQMINKFEPFMEEVDFRDQRFRPIYSGRQNFAFAQHSSNIGSHKMDNGWPKFRSKYMTTEELENILRMQHAATHCNDPYVDDYYHQACLAKKNSGSNLKHHFCPNVANDLSSRARSKDEPHAYLQVDALGRLSFSSTRRPRPLLEVEPQSMSADNMLDQKSSVKPLDQEPMLAARITIDYGFCLLLDADDLDRLLQFSQTPDGGSQLSRKKEILLQELAESFQLVDPLGPSGQSGVALKDDFVFLRLLSLPKGRKLLSRYLQLLSPGSEITRVACMAIFRHLRFIFGVMPLDPSAAETTANLAKAISSCMRGMGLGALSACLAAVVCSSEQPPLRPLGNSAGDGASVIIKSVLDKATVLLTDHNTASNYSIPTRNLWQASFNAFFGLLTKYCLNKYDGVMQSLNMQATNVGITGSEVTRAISREMPVELLRSSLPHTNEHQRKVLLDFAQRTIPTTGQDAHVGSNGN